MFFLINCQKLLRNLNHDSLEVGIDTTLIERGGRGSLPSTRPNPQCAILAQHIGPSANMRCYLHLNGTCGNLHQCSHSFAKL